MKSGAQRLAIAAVAAVWWGGSAAVSGCATSMSIESRAVAPRLKDASDRYIVAAVDNDDVMAAGHAGSTPRGYDGLTTYGPSSHARRTMQDLEKEFGLREINAWPIAALHMHCAVLEIDANANRDALLSSLARDPRVRLAQPLQMFQTQTSKYDDPYVGLQRGFAQMEVADAHAISRGNGVRVAVIDTGADIEHPDLRGAVLRAVNFVDDDSQQFRSDRHGTEVAGVIAAVANNGRGIVGVAPGSRLLVLKACWQLQVGNDAARCNSFTLAKALAAALDAHAQVVNLSLAGPDDPLLRDLIEEGLRRGTVFVGAAPPADLGGKRFLQQDGVIAVASAGAGSGTPAAAAAPAQGALLYAPGQEVLTLLPGDRYDFASGSSLAAAQVTGTVALLLAKNPRLTTAAVYRLLQHSSSAGLADVDAAGSINACAAVVALAGGGSCRKFASPNKSSSDERMVREALR